jgi:hypothetical protein
MSLQIGRRVEHIEYGWTGKVAVGGHTDDEIMVIWDNTGGASLVEPDEIRWLDE